MWSWIATVIIHVCVRVARNKTMPSNVPKPHFEQVPLCSSHLVLALIDAADKNKATISERCISNCHLPVGAFTIDQCLFLPL